MDDPKEPPTLSRRVTPKAQTPPLRPPRPPLGVPLKADGCYALPDGNPCVGCDHCCRYITVEIPKPRTKLDFDNIRWYILHRNVSVFLDWEGSWMIQFDTPCEWLVEGRCTHYQFRPEICRDYDPADCERYSTTAAERILLRTEEDLERYLAEREARNAAKRAAKRTGKRAAAGRGRANGAARTTGAPAKRKRKRA